MFRSLLSYIFVREFLVQDVLYLQGGRREVRERGGGRRGGECGVCVVWFVVCGLWCVLLFCSSLTRVK